MQTKVLEFLKESNAIEGVYDADSLLQSYRAWSFIIKEKELTVINVRKTHKILMLGQPIRSDERGHFRKRPVFVGGKEALKYFNIFVAMEPWCLNAWLDPKYWKKHHIRYEQIHPFIDGNGRTGRIFVNWQRLKAGLPILVIKESEKAKYYKWFK